MALKGDREFSVSERWVGQSSPGTIGQLIIIDGISVEPADPPKVTGLQFGEILGIAEPHQLAGGAGMIEAEGMADLMDQRIADVLDIRVAVKLRILIPCMAHKFG